MNFKKMFCLIIMVIISASLFTGCNTAKVSKTIEPTIKSKADLTNKRIGVQQGTTGDTLVTKDYTGAQISRYNKAVDAAVDLKNGKIDAIVLDALPSKKIVEKNPDLMVLSEELTKEEYAIAVKKGNSELLTSINKTLERIKKDGKYDSFVNAFMPLDESQKIVLPARAKTNFKTTLKMGTNAEFEPFEYRQGTNVIGFDVEVANEIAADKGENLKIEDMAFDSLIATLDTGKIDMVVAGLSVTDERKQHVDFSEPYFNASQVIIVKNPNVAKK